MKNCFVFLIIVFVCLSVNVAFASGITPHVDTGPGGSLAVKFEVGSTQGSESWMYMEFSEPVIPSIEPGTDHSIITVSFDVYRPTPVSGNFENFWWHWEFTDVDGNPDTYPPIYGLQWDGGPGTPNPKNYPLGWGTGNDFMAIEYQQWDTIEMTWNFIAGKASSSINGTSLDYQADISDITSLNGWWFSLQHDSERSGSSSVWVDNLSITGSVIYATDFDNFTQGSINGQDGWEAGTELPEASTLLLLGFGLLGLAGFNRKKIL